MTHRIGIAGITGRMGHLLAEEVRAAGADLVGGIGRPGSHKRLAGGATRFPDIASLAGAADVVLDFTLAAAARPHAAALTRAGTAWVLGTSGLSATDEAAVTEAARHIPVVQAANFSAGMTLVLALAERMGAALPADAYDAEIVEMHHRQKIDAPSGAAIAIGRAVAKGRGVALDALMESGRHGHTGTRKPGAIGFAALRGGQVVGEHTLIFAAGSEHLELTHRVFDRRSFAVGAVRAALWVAGRAPGHYAMAEVLGIADRPAAEPA